jgi:hypothetical protein
MATGKKTGGRRKGTPNKATSVKFAEIAATGETPLDYMLRVMRDKTIEHDRRDKMAAACAPYVHPKLASLEHSGKDGEPITVNITKDDGAL